jgi:ubiquinone/menaquinone biosynthesis C-methylase UbiE
MEQLMRKKKDVAITGSLAVWYDKNSRTSRQEEFKEYARLIAERALPEGSVLEIAPGPGDTSIELARLGGFHITAMDLSSDVVEICKANARREGVTIEVAQGNVSSMPFAAGNFDFLFCSAAFKNFHDPARALVEMHRVLKPGGKGLILDMNGRNTHADRKAAIDAMRLAGLEKLFMTLSFRFFLRPGSYTKEQFEAFLEASPFQTWQVEERGLELRVSLEK